MRKVGKEGTKAISVGDDTRTADSFDYYRRKGNFLRVVYIENEVILCLLEGAFN